MWYDHDGESWPEHAHPEEIVEVEHRGGYRDVDRVQYFWSDRPKANEWLWDGGGADIMRYRIRSQP